MTTTQCKWRLAAKLEGSRRERVGSHIRGRRHRHLLSCRAIDESSNSVFDADLDAMWFFDASKEKRVQVSGKSIEERRWGLSLKRTFYRLYLSLHFSNFVLCFLALII